MEDWSKKRKEWSDARDKKLGLKAGAVKGISLGDELDKAGKAAGKSYAAMAAALERLKPVLARYVAGLPKGSDKAKAWIKTNLQDALDADLAAIAADQKSLAWIKKELIDDLVATIFAAQPDSGKLRNVDQVMKAKPGMTWEQAAAAVNLMQITSKVVAANAKRVGELSKIAWKAKLPGHDADYKACEGYVAALRSDVVFYGKWAQVKTLDDYLQFMKASRGRSNAEQPFDALRKAVASLSG